MRLRAVQMLVLVATKRVKLPQRLVRQHLTSNFEMMGNFSFNHILTESFRCVQYVLQELLGLNLPLFLLMWPSFLV